MLGNPNKAVLHIKALQSIHMYNNTKPTDYKVWLQQIIQSEVQYMGNYYALDNA